MSETRGLFASLKRLLGTSLGIVSTRLELLSNEWQEERIRLIRMLVLVLFAVFFACMAMVLLAIFIVAIFWHDHPFLAISILSLLCFVLSALCAFSLRNLWYRGSMLFSASLAELRRDCLELEPHDE